MSDDAGSALRDATDLIVKMRVEIIAQLDTMNASLLDALTTLQTHAETAGRLFREGDPHTALDHASKVIDIQPILEQQINVLRDMLQVLHRAYSH